MGSMIDEEYISKFLELLRYVPYLKEENTKIQQFMILMSLDHWRRPSGS